MKYKDQPYVKITPTERAKGQIKEVEKVALYYAASGDALVVTLNENVLKRSIDRQLARQRPKRTRQTARRPSRQKPWLGSNLACTQTTRFSTSSASCTKTPGNSTCRFAPGAICRS